MPVRAVTFDCWNTLLRDPGVATAADHARIDALASAARVPADRAKSLLKRAWEIHASAWHAGHAFTGRDAAAWCLVGCGITDRSAHEALARHIEDAVLLSDIRAVDGAAETLAQLRQKGLRTALICDTGFSPGRAVRKLLDRVGLLEYLEHTAFSDEVGAPKPHAAMFRAALEPLAVPPEEGLHVGDLRRTDVGGARAVGMKAVRYRGVLDDKSHYADGDVVIDDLRQLVGLVG